MYFTDPKLGNYTITGLQLQFGLQTTVRMTPYHPDVTLHPTELQLQTPVSGENKENIKNNQKKENKKTNRAP